MRLTDVHGALAAAYGRSTAQTTGKRKVESPFATGQEADRQNQAQAASSRVQDFAAGVEKFMQNLGVELKFNVTDSGEVQAEVRHPDGDKVIRKIPPDEVLELAESIKQMTGAFVDKAF